MFIQLRATNTLIRSYYLVWQAPFLYKMLKSEILPIHKIQISNGVSYRIIIFVIILTACCGIILQHVFIIIAD